MFKTAFRIVASLQEELFTLDNSVAQAKRTYDTATRELLKQQKCLLPAVLKITPVDMGF